MRRYRPCRIRSPIQGLLFRLLKEGFNVSLGTVQFRSSYGTDFDNSEIARPAI